MTKIKATFELGNSYCIFLRGGATGGTFSDQYCKRFYLNRLTNAVLPYDVSLHAYAILPDSVLLFVTVRNRSGVQEMISKTNAAYTEYFQTRFSRNTKPLMQEMRVSHVLSDELALDCQKHIERSPVELGECSNPGEYEFSSYPVNGFGCRSSSLSKHIAFYNYLYERGSSLKSYRSFVASGFDIRYRNYLHTRIHSGLPLQKHSKPVSRPLIRKRNLAYQRYHPFIA